MRKEGKCDLTWSERKCGLLSRNVISKLCKAKKRQGLRIQRLLIGLQGKANSLVKLSGCVGH